MKKLLIILAFISCIVSESISQSVGIGTTTPNTNSILDLTSISKGLLLPRMTTTQRNVIPAVAGMVVNDTDYKEFYHNDGTTWRKMLNSTFWNSSATRSWIYNTTDSVAIGLSTAKERLNVYNGNLYMQDNRTGKSPHVIFDVPATNFKEGGLQFTRLGDTLAAINYREVSGNANYLKLSVSNNAIGSDLIVNSKGNIGMGISNPSVKLHLYDPFATEMMRLEGEAPLIQLRRRTSASNIIPITLEDVGFLQTSSNDIRIGTNSSNTTGKFIIRTNSNDNVTEDGDGEMGIGT